MLKPDDAAKQTKLHDARRKSRLVSKPMRGHRGMEEACFPHLYEPINHTKPFSKTEHHRHLAHENDFLFLVLSLPQKRGAGWGGGAQRARGNEMNTARRQNMFRACRFPVFRIVNQKYQKIEVG